MHYTHTIFNLTLHAKYSITSQQKKIEKNRKISITNMRDKAQYQWPFSSIFLTT